MTRTQGCTECGHANHLDRENCTRCRATIAPPSFLSLQYVWAYLVTGIITFIPANTYPILITKGLAQNSQSTILGGVFELFSHGSYAIAIVVFVASILIPVGKFIAIAYLAISVKRAAQHTPHSRARLYNVVELIGRWSMIDVFVVAILAALVQLDAVAVVQPGIASITFALSIVFTMLSAQSFDQRLLWYQDTPYQHPHHSAATLPSHRVL